MQIKKRNSTCVKIKQVCQGGWYLEITEVKSYKIRSLQSKENCTHDRQALHYNVSFFYRRVERWKNKYIRQQFYRTDMTVERNCVKMALLATKYTYNM